MKNATIYSQWKKLRRQIPVPESFAAGVMARIEKQAPYEEYELPDALGDMRNRLMRWGVAAGLTLLGLFRILYIAVNLLRANPLVPY